MKYIIAINMAFLCISLNGQTNFQNSGDTSMLLLNSDAMYHRPGISGKNLPFTVGGYIDVNSYSGATNGSMTGFSFEMPDLAFFLSSNLNKHISFLSEAAFESGAEKFKLRMAAVDIKFNKLFNIRTGLILNPIGAFNQNHDGPNYEFVDRPMVSTEILPAVFSNVGAGLHGKVGNDKWAAGYELYMTNGFNDKIIDNELDRTSLRSGVSSYQNTSGKPMFTGKLALRNKTAGEIGISYMRGIYSELDAAQSSVGAMAIDYSNTFLARRLSVRAELASLHVDVPDTYLQTYASRQMGAFVDVVGTVLERPIWHWDHAKFNIGVRLEYVDYNQGSFTETQGNIFHEIRSIVPSISFRPTPSTVLRLNYRYQENVDFLGNTPTKTGAIQVGLSTYF